MPDARPGIILLVLAAVLLAACGGRSQPVAPAVPAAAPPGLAQRIALPAPGALGRQLIPEAPPRRASFEFSSSVNYGGNFNGLPYAQVEANASVEAVFAPQYDPQAEPPLTEPAYAGYYFYGLDTFNGPPQLILEWSAPPAEGCLWVALANFVRGTWDWFALDSGILTTLSVDSLAPYTRPADSYLYLYVVLTGTQAAQLQYVVLGQPAAPSLTIFTNLSGTPPNGLAPLQVEYDFAAGTPGSLVTGFDIDWEGDGTLDELGLNELAPSHLFDPGTFTTAVTLHTSDGQSAVDTYNFVATDPDNQPPVAALAAIPDGSGFYAVTLDASLSTDEDTIIAYEWDVDADPWADITTTEPTLPYVFCESGAQTVSVTVRDNDLAGATASRSFTLSNALGKTALVGGFTTAPECSLALSTVGVSALRPGVAWFDTTARKLYYQQGNANGSVWGPVQAPTGGTLNAGWGVSLSALPAAGNSWPNLVYGSGELNTDYVLRYRYALNEDGTDWSDEVAIGSLFHLGGQNRLLNVNGKPAVASVHKWDYSGVAEIYYSAASDVAGTSWGSLQKIVGPLVGNFGDFQVLSCCWAIATIRS